MQTSSKPSSPHHLVSLAYLEVKEGGDPIQATTTTVAKDVAGETGFANQLDVTKLLRVEIYRWRGSSSQY